MTRSYVLERKQILPRPLDEVFSFFADAANLETLTPASLHFHILTPPPIELQAGTVIHYRLRLSGIPFKWKTLIESFEPGKRFTDVQAKGPYRRWHHTHEFFAVPEGTLVVDRVEYELPLGPLGRIAHALFVKRSLKKIFDYRRERLEEIFPAREAVAVP